MNDNRRLSRLCWAALALGLLAACAVGQDAQRQWTVEEDRWYVVELGGGRAGWMNMVVESSAGRYRTGVRTKLSMDRGPAKVGVEIATAFVETADGRPVSMSMLQDMGLQPVHTEWTFREDGSVLETSRQGGREIVRERPAPDPESGWLTPRAVERLWQQSLEARAQRIAYTTLDPQAGLEPVSVTHVRVQESEHEAGGKSIPVTVWETSNSLMPITATEKYAADGALVYQRVNMGLGDMVMRLATKAEAQADIEQAPELLISTFVEPDRPIERAREATTATLQLRMKEGTMPVLPSAGAQRSHQRLDNRAATLFIDIDANVAATEQEIADPAYRESSAMLEADDPLIRKLAERAVRHAGDDPAQRAEALRAAVHELLTEKGLDTAFATASETARTRAGDCSEHAVLLAAMLRAQGIPSRVAVGLVYADSFLGRKGIFGWHMWTQALIDGRWVDFDPTLDRRFHAGHVLTGTASLEDGALNAELATTVLLMGRLEIDVTEVGYDADD